MCKALVAEGGAMRGIFAAGVLDTFLNHSVTDFDFCLGVSAGASNLATFAAGVPGLSKKIITEYATKRAFFSPLRFIQGGHMTDVHWLWQQCKASLPGTPNEFEQMPFYAGITNTTIGQCEYPRVTFENIDDIMVASCAIPTAYRDQPEINGVRYCDGGVADPIPVRQAYAMGARNITVVLSKPLSFVKPDLKAGWLIDKLYGQQPGLADALKRRSAVYNETRQFLLSPPDDLTLTVLAPDDNFGVKRLTMNKFRLMLGYRSGMNAARALLRKQRAA